MGGGEAGLGDQGYEVTLVDNGVDALFVFANEKLDVAVIDVMLPRMSGFELCRRHPGNRKHDAGDVDHRAEMPWMTESSGWTPEQMTT